MKLNELRSLPTDEIHTEIQRAREKIFKLTFRDKGTPVESPGTVKVLKKDIARMLTVLRERELGAERD